MTALTRPLAYIPTFAIYQNRAERRKFWLYQDDETAAGIADDDVVRVKIWQTTDTIDLDVGSDTATANGSIVVVDEIGSDGSSPAVVILVIDNEDAAALSAGLYNIEIGLVDNSQEGDPFETIARGQVIVLGSPSGDIGL